MGYKWEDGGWGCANVEAQAQAAGLVPGDYDPLPEPKRCTLCGEPAVLLLFGFPVCTVHTTEGE